MGKHKGSCTKRAREQQQWADRQRTPVREPESPVQRYPCPRCGATVAALSDLDAHNLAQHGG